MEKEILFIKKQIDTILSSSNGCINFTKKIGKRNENVFFSGKTCFSESKILFENDKFKVFSQNIDVDTEKEIVTLLNKSI